MNETEIYIDPTAMTRLSSAAAANPHATAPVIDDNDDSAAPQLKFDKADRLFSYALSVVLVLIAHGIVAVVSPVVHPAADTIFLGAVVLSALYGGRGPALVATVLASLDLDFNFIPPYRSFALEFDNVLYLLTFLAVALVTSSLQARRRRAESELRAAHDELEQRVRTRTAELLRSQEQFTLLVNGVRDQAFIVLDSQQQVASWNAGAERLLGYRAADVIGRPLVAIWPGCERVTLASDRSEYQDWLRRADGRLLWSGIFLTPVQDALGRPRGLAVAMRDISERRSLERDILEISERERERIGRDLHDGIGQELTGAAMLCTAMAGQLEDDGVPQARAAEDVANLINDSIRHTRELARGLAPINLENQGLASALRQLAERVARVPNLKCTCESSGNINLDEQTASHLYRIAQEATNNALRHGHATHIDLTLSDHDGRVTLSIADDGVGFDPSSSDQGMGLRLMRYRARAIRGVLDIRPGGRGGTIVSCSVDAASSAHDLEATEHTAGT